MIVQTSLSTAATNFAVYISSCPRITLNAISIAQQSKTPITSVASSSNRVPVDTVTSDRLTNSPTSSC